TTAAPSAPPPSSAAIDYLLIQRCRPVTTHSCRCVCRQRCRLQPFAARIKSKAGHLESPEGRLLENLQEIRVFGFPTWNADRISVELAFIFGVAFLPRMEPTVGEHMSLKRERPPAKVAAELVGATEPSQVLSLWYELVDAWLRPCVLATPVQSISAELVNADEFTTDRYWSSYQLDLDYLSDSDDRT
ncbi:MAG: hypothetical protein ACR2MY_11070, partial [Candidatus Dormibacteria bacterium]